MCKKRVLGVCRWVPCVCKKWVLCGHGVGAAGERWVLGVREAGAVPVQVGAVSVQEVGAAGEQRARWDQGRIPGGLRWGLPLSTPKGPPSPCPSLRPLPQGPWAPAAVLRGETTTAGTGGGELSVEPGGSAPIFRVTSRLRPHLQKGAVAAPRAQTELSGRLEDGTALPSFELAAPRGARAPLHAQQHRAKTVRGGCGPHSTTTELRALGTGIALGCPCSPWGEQEGWEGSPQSAGWQSAPPPVPSLMPSL